MERSCDFCGKTEGRVRLVAGKGYVPAGTEAKDLPARAHICSECVAVAANILADEVVATN